MLRWGGRLSASSHFSTFIKTKKAKISDLISLPRLPWQLSKCHPTATQPGANHVEIKSPLPFQPSPPRKGTGHHPPSGKEEDAESGKKKVHVDYQTQILILKMGSPRTSKTVIEIWKPSLGRCRRTCRTKI